MELRKGGPIDGELVQVFLRSRFVVRVLSIDQAANEDQIVESERGVVLVWQLTDTSALVPASTFFTKFSGFLGTMKLATLLGASHRCACRSQPPYTMQEALSRISTNYEAGLDFRMFKNRIGIDFTFYYNKTKNQILDAPMDPTTGYSRATINSGNVRNRGYELELTATPVKTRTSNGTVR